MGFFDNKIINFKNDLLQNFEVFREKIFKIIKTPDIEIKLNEIKKFIDIFTISSLTSATSELNNLGRQYSQNQINLENIIFGMTIEIEFYLALLNQSSKFQEDVVYPALTPNPKMLYFVAPGFTWFLTSTVTFSIGFLRFGILFFTFKKILFRMMLFLLDIDCKFFCLNEFLLNILPSVNQNYE